VTEGTDIIHPINTSHLLLQLLDELLLERLLLLRRLDLLQESVVLCLGLLLLGVGLLQLLGNLGAVGIARAA
jgi:hypothetical protein